jgi:hypothetical protein
MAADDGRLIDITPPGPATADDEVELIAEDAVAPIGERMQYETR